jgi:hypothetical protein
VCLVCARRTPCDRQTLLVLACRSRVRVFRPVGVLIVRRPVPNMIGLAEHSSSGKRCSACDATCRDFGKLHRELPILAVAGDFCVRLCPLPFFSRFSRPRLPARKAQRDPGRRLQSEETADFGHGN